MIGLISWQIPIGILLLALGAFFLAGNWACLAFNRSMVPPVGGFLCFFGLLLVGAPYYWAWIGLVSDPGILLIIWFPFLLHELWSWSRYCRLRQFISKSDDKTITISLYKRNKASILFEYHRPTDSTETPFCISQSLAGIWATAGNDIRLTGFPEWQKATLIQTGNQYEVCVQSEDRNPDGDISMDRMLFIEQSNPTKSH